jgi:DNA-binding NarL/FixJ family response regulator
VDCGTVLVVDADDVWRSETAALLLQVGHDAAGAATAADALELARHERPSLVILDVALPDLDGYEVCRQLRDRYGDKLPIILVSADRNEPHDRIAALLIGADDYLAKPYNPGELLARVRRHLTRANGSNGKTTSERDTNGSGTNGSGTIGLTPRELDVLRLLASGLNQGEIARELVISPKTVSSHIQRVLAKLGVHSRAQAVTVAHREGLVADFAAHSVVFAAPVPVG